MSNTADIAVPAGVNESGERLFARGPRLLTEDELLAAVEEDYEKAAEEAKLEQELWLVNRRVRSYDAATLDCLRTFKAVDDDADSVSSRAARGKCPRRLTADPRRPSPGSPTRALSLYTR